MRVRQRGQDLIRSVRRLTLAGCILGFIVAMADPSSVAAAPPPLENDIPTDLVGDAPTDPVGDDESFVVLDLDDFVFKNTELTEPTTDEVVPEPDGVVGQLPVTGGAVGGIAVVAAVVL